MRERDRNHQAWALLEWLLPWMLLGAIGWCGIGFVILVCVTAAKLWR